MKITDKQAIDICKRIGLYNAIVFAKDLTCISIVDDSYTVGFYYDGTVVMYKYKTPYWNDIRTIYRELDKLGL